MVVNALYLPIIGDAHGSDNRGRRPAWRRGAGGDIMLCKPSSYQVYISMEFSTYSYGSEEHTHMGR